MIVTFEQTYLQELYTEGKASDKHHRFQPQIVGKYVKVINLMKQQENVLGLTKYGSLHYEKLHGDKEEYPRFVLTTSTVLSSLKAWRLASRLPRYVTSQICQTIINEQEDET